MAALEKSHRRPDEEVVDRQILTLLEIAGRLRQDQAEDIKRRDKALALKKQIDAHFAEHPDLVWVYIEADPDLPLWPWEEWRETSLPPPWAILLFSAYAVNTNPGALWMLSEPSGQDDWGYCEEEFPQVEDEETKARDWLAVPKKPDLEDGDAEVCLFTKGPEYTEVYGGCVLLEVWGFSRKTHAKKVEPAEIKKHIIDMKRKQDEAEAKRLSEEAAFMFS